MRLNTLTAYSQLIVMALQILLFELFNFKNDIFFVTLVFHEGKRVKKITYSYDVGTLTVILLFVM